MALPARLLRTLFVFCKYDDGYRSLCLLLESISLTPVSRCGRFITFLTEPSIAITLAPTPTPTLTGNPRELEP
jgi:hypothetical protein